MKQLFFYLCILVSSVSCGSSQTDERPKSPNFTIVDEYGIDRTFIVVQIDSCEYLMYNVGYNTGVMTHKGNCKNPVHK